MHYCEEACTRCLAIEQDTKRKVSPFTYRFAYINSRCGAVSYLHVCHTVFKW